MRYLLGADIGQKRDYTAVCVLAYDEIDAKPRYTTCYLHRFPLGTPYDVITDALVELAGTPPLSKDVTTVVDATGVGAPILNALSRAGLDPIGVKIHGGRGITRDEHDGTFSVPKRDLAMVIAQLLEAKRLRIPTRLAASGAVLRELETFRAKIEPEGSATYEAWRTRDHDDYVLAIACAAWVGEHHHGTPILGRDFFEHHIAAEPLTPDGGGSLVRGWRVHELTACVWLERGRDQRLRVLYEHPPQPGQDLLALKASVLQVRGILFSRFHVLDVVEDAAPDPYALGRRGSASLLRPEIIPMQGERNVQAQHAKLRDWLGRMGTHGPAFMVDPRCAYLIRALRDGYRYQRLRGETVDRPEPNHAAALMEALLTALAAPTLAFSRSERARIMGPRVLIPE